ncbi:DUF3037 domain-containing protein [Dyadobacter flavalbus]|uniref:DUF3037 domain-containing protein n=1 Tax=Dyadobacter flavalbus TaxID=2579942 RepID=A0A5M8Q8N1_9BACT|nr:DUF3037 domain-containing protein [Dyadobacter flavalbus]KAA6431553.1 DUF3037 domain-containing protein [Dyadobacter flavalbus]
MHENHLFEYAVIRVVPRVEREEFMNVGVILYCPGKNYLQFVFKVNEARLCAFSENIDIKEIMDYLDALRRICEGRKAGGPIGSLPLSSRFRWLTATRSTVVQSSKVHPGFCKDPDETLQRLFEQQIG